MGIPHGEICLGSHACFGDPLLSPMPIPLATRPRPPSLFKAECDFQDNAVHASASPLEALKDLVSGVACERLGYLKCQLTAQLSSTC